MLAQLATRFRGVSIQATRQTPARLARPAHSANGASHVSGPASPSLATHYIGKAPDSYRAYAKVVKTKRKLVKKNISPSEPKPLYDEDFEDGSDVNEDALDFEDATQEMRSDRSFARSSAQIEQILRSTMPPELVDQAIAEHRRLYPAFQAGTITEEQASKAGFSRRLSQQEILDSAREQGHLGSASSSKAAIDPSQVPITVIDKKNPQKPISIRTSLREPSSSPSEMMPEHMTYDYDDETEDLESPKAAKSLKSTGSKKKTSAKSTKKRAPVASEEQVSREMQELENEEEEFEHGKGSMEARRENLKAFAQEQKDEAGLNASMHLHRRMAKLKEILNSEEASVPTPKRGYERIEAMSTSVSATMARAKGLLAEGKWKEARLVYVTLAKNLNESKPLSDFATVAFGAKQYEEAGLAAIEAFNMNERDVKANIVAARVMLETHEPDASDALKRLSLGHQHIDRALEVHDDWPDLLSIKGSLYMKMKKYKTACLYFKRALHLFEKNKFSRDVMVNFYRDYAKSLAGRGKYKTALSYLKIAHAAEPQNIEIISLLAELHERGFNDIEAAAPFYKLAIQINPEDVPSLVRLGQLYSDPSYSAQSYAMARQCYERAMFLQPLADFWFPLGWLSMHMGENDKAMTCLQKAAEMDPSADNRWTAVILMAEIYAFDENPDTQLDSTAKAINLYKFALEEKSEPNVKLNLAKCLMRLARLEEAEALLKEIGQDGPANCDLKCMLADTYYMNDRVTEAMREVDQILKEYPREKQPHFMKAKYLFEAGHLVEAIPYLEFATSKDSDEAMAALLQRAEEDPKLIALRSAVEPIVKASAASVHQSESKVHPDSLLGYADNVQAPPFTGEALRLLGTCYVSANRISDAKNALGRALNSDPENSSLLIALGECQYQLGEVEDAVYSFRKASVLDRNAIRPNFQLGSLVAESGRPDQAITYYLKILDILHGRETAPDQWPSEEIMDEEELANILQGVYTNLSLCYKEMASKDKHQFSSYMKASQMYAKKAKEMTEAE